MPRLLVGVLCLLAAEGLYRGYVFISKPLFRPSSLAGMGWEFTPGAVIQHFGIGEKTMTYRINDNGFRDESGGTWKPWLPSDLKIAIIGDSVTTGSQVDYEETYSARLEEDLVRLGTQARVINYGIEATNTRQHFALMKGRVLALKPDIVLLAYSLNDIEMRYLDKLPPVMEKLIRHWHYWSFLLNHLVRARRVNQIVAQGDKSLPTKDSDPIVCPGAVSQILQLYKTEKWLVTAGWIRKMADLARAENIRFGVIVLPMEPQVSGVCPLDAQTEIDSFLRQAGIQFLDMAKQFDKKSSAVFYIAGDLAHLTPVGHIAAAYEITKWLQAQHLLA